MKRVATTIAVCFGFGVILGASLAGAAEGDQPAPAAISTEAPAETKDAAAAENKDAAAAGNGFESKETVCKNGKNVRKVKLGYADIKTGSDCKVSYLKETEEPGNEKVLWNARSDAKFCQDHAQTFVTKLQGQGWTCE